jgi:hypothetical protein
MALEPAYRLLVLNKMAQVLLVLLDEEEFSLMVVML